MNPQARATVLVVDDTADNLMLAKELLQPHYEVKLANSGRTALRIATLSPPPN